jgi:hypothetical protein
MGQTSSSNKPPDIKLEMLLNMFLEKEKDGKLKAVEEKEKSN